jgi:AraC-like DNA-binding protein
MDEPVLAGSTGRYEEFRPTAALGAHFRCVWSNDITPAQAGRYAVVPDGCVDITWIDGELIVAGPDVTVAVSPSAPAEAIVGVRFRPDAAASWLGLPMSKIVGGRIALAEFWGARAREIAARMGDVKTIAERMRVLEQALCRLAPDVDPPRADMGFVFNALRTESAGPRMAVILDRLDMSPRTLRRRCHEAFGYGPKTLDRILRFQRFMKLARQADEPSLAGLAFAAGYADQAHMTRELKALAGVTPRDVIREAAVRNLQDAA